MSEDKKTSWGKAYEGAAPESKPAAVQAASDAAATPAAAAPPSDGDPDGPPRARHQHVLPGILGKQLRVAYGELLNTPLPDSITDLVKKLERQEAEKAAAKSEDEEGNQ
jgi:hypothetical protein